jgi:alginate O-acetyltransferase complex protein AlgI
LFLAIERFFSRGFGAKVASWRSGRMGWLVGCLQIFLTFNVVSFLWLLFQLPDFSQVLAYFRELRAWHPGFAPQSIYTILVFGLPVILYHVWGYYRDRMVTNAARDSRAARWALDLVYAVMLVLILTNSGSPGEFIYFQF